MFAQMSDEELIRRSDLIILGEWVGQTPLQIAGTAENLVLGAIVISEVVKGPSANSIALIAIAPAAAPRSGDDLSYRRGNRGMWLLRQRPGSTGLYLADHPQRFVSAHDNGVRIETLRRIAGQR